MRLIMRARMLLLMRIGTDIVNIVSTIVGVCAIFIKCVNLANIIGITTRMLTNILTFFNNYLKSIFFIARIIVTVWIIILGMFCLN